MNLGGSYGNYQNTGVQNSLKFMLFLGLGYTCTLVGMGLIPISANDSNSGNSGHFKGYHYF